MSTESVDKKYIIIESIMRWILFSNVFVVSPPLLYAVYRIIVGYEVNLFEYVPDMLLVILSVCCNLVNAFTDSQKKVVYIARWLFGIIFGMVGFICWGLFLIIRINPTGKIVTSSLLYRNTTKIFCMFVLIIIISVILGCIIEWCTNKSKK